MRRDALVTEINLVRRRNKKIDLEIYIFNYHTSTNKRPSIENIQA